MFRWHFGIDWFYILHVQVIFRNRFVLYCMFRWYFGWETVVLLSNRGWGFWLSFQKVKDQQQNILKSVSLWILLRLSCWILSGNLSRFSAIDFWSGLVLFSFDVFFSSFEGFNSGFEDFKHKKTEICCIELLKKWKWITQFSNCLKEPDFQSLTRYHVASAVESFWPQNSEASAGKFLEDSTQN